MEFRNGDDTAMGLDENITGDAPTDAGPDAGADTGVDTTKTAAKKARPIATAARKAIEMDTADKGSDALTEATATAMAEVAKAVAQDEVSEERPREDSKRVNARRFTVKTDPSRDANLTEFGKETLTDRYLLPGEDYQELFARVADAYADDAEHAQRLYDYISRLWFMPATPVLSNGGTGRGLPISCYLNSVSDSLDGIVNTWNE
ncbi:MAG: ribonucleotide reductase N-terminal alpha domain-containing protein, partial [Alteraurantiacibacter sp. bin_em_oilr2.035]|nr:ribonucleotide reductase N-terminal alpha domain-containing protein [Alteraurantiacibacter sp. bin_em_oilr2.035]